MTKAIRMVHDIDPKRVIWDAIGEEAAEIEVLGSQLLVSAYVRPNKTAGGILLSDKTRGEDAHQGKIGLVLKMGSLAFQDDGEHRFGGKTPQVGDWVLFRVGDGFPFMIGENNCRFIEDVAIKAIISTPDAFW